MYLGQVPEMYLGQVPEMYISAEGVLREKGRGGRGGRGLGRGGAWVRGWRACVGPTRVGFGGAHGRGAT